jgi:tetratricopeptide (TPR) repeat protein
MRHLPIAALIPIVAFPVFAAAGSENSSGFDDLIQQGRSALLAADPARAESIYNQACPADFVSAYPVAKAVTCENALASVDETRGNLSRAEQRYVHAVNAAERAGPAYRPLYCARLIDLGEYYHHHGRGAEAEASFLKAVELARGLTGTPQLLPEALIRLGGLYADSPTPERGRVPLSEALGVVQDRHGGGAPVIAAGELAHAHSELGAIELAAGHLREAESHLRESIALATRELGEDHPVTAGYQANLAFMLLVNRQFGSAGILFRRAQFVVESRPEPSGRELGTIYTGLSALADAEGKLALAEDYARRAISILSLDQKPDVMAIAMARVALAGICLRTHDMAEAEKILPAAVETQRAGVHPNTLAASILLLGELREQQRNWQAAESLYREAIGIYDRQASGPTNPLAAQLLRALAEVLKKDGGSIAEVRSLEARARDIARQASKNNPRA